MVRVVDYGVHHSKVVNISVYGTEIPVRLCVNSDGDDFVVVANSNPCKYYIAIDRESNIISMTDDPEQSQIEGYRIIGIDSDFGRTWGQGGNVYGCRWDGSKIIPKEDISPLYVGSIGFWRQLAKVGLITKDECLLVIRTGALPKVISGLIDGLPNEDDRFDAEIRFSNSTINSDDPLLISLRLTPQFWIAADSFK